MRKNQADILSKLFISQFMIALEYKTWYQSNAMTKRLYLMGRYEKNLICISINFNDNIWKEWKNHRKIMGAYLQKWSYLTQY